MKKNAKRVQRRYQTVAKVSPTEHPLNKPTEGYHVAFIGAWLARSVAGVGNPD